MEEVVKWLLEWAKDSPVWVTVIASAFVAVSMGPAFGLCSAFARQRADIHPTLMTTQLNTDLPAEG